MPPVTGVRVLAASTGGAGHFAPLVPVLDALAGLGSRPLVCAPPGLRAAVDAAGHRFRLGADPPEQEAAALTERFAAVPPDEGSVLMNREMFGRLCTAAMLPAVVAAVRDWHPGLVVREPCEYASAIAAERAGVPHVQVAISVAGAEWSALTMVAPALESFQAGIVERLRASAYLTRFPASIDPAAFPSTHRYRTGQDRPRPLPDWWGGSEAPLVYITFGTVAGALAGVGAAACRAALDAVSKLPVRALLTTGHATERAALPPIPANVHVASWVPQEQVLGDAAVVVCHGGAGTTLGALAAGVPLVILPLFADQPVNARRVTATGAAINVDPAADPAGGIAEVGRDESERLAAAIETVLADRSHRRAAGRIAAEMRALPELAGVLAALLDRAGRPSDGAP